MGAGVLAGDDLVAVVRELAARRADALRTLDTEALTGVDAGGSPALLEDVRLVEDVRARGARWSGLAFDVREVVVEEAGADRAVVLATVVTGAHEVQSADGSLTAVRASEPRASRLVLVRVDGQWRVSDVA
ncbi:hypothetical protein [Kineococcus terrestris]|uniref:hypothetical protein n=1 Tax=Kineococcus terrestris TaxID=2044856 RepID=UPI0034DB01FB